MSHNFGIFLSQGYSTEPNHRYNVVLMRH